MIEVDDPRYGTREAGAELEVFGIMGAISHELDRVDEFLGSFAEQMSPFLVTVNSKPMPDHPPTAIRDDLSEVARRLLDLRERTERIANNLLTLRDRVR